MKPKVSVVVPIYGVEKYLHQCVDSILAQTLEDIEVILVDDGSKDRCPEIVDEYARKDARVVAIHQPNGGYGRAVNHGIENATGEYIGIIESDDWIEPTMYEKLYENAKLNNTDVTKCNFYIYNSFRNNEEERNVVWKSHHQDLTEAPDNVFTIEEYPKLLMFHASIWASIYRADFVKKIPLVESPSASYQDFPFMVEVMCRAKRISVVKEPLLHYRMEEGQNSSTIRRDARLLLMPTQCLEGKKVLQKYGKYEKLKEEFCFHAYRACIGFYRAIYWKYKYQFLKKLQLIFKDADISSFKKEYLSNQECRIIRCLQKGRLFASLQISSALIRQFLVSVRIRRNGFLIQLFGIQICKNAVTRPALIRIKL